MGYAFVRWQKLHTFGACQKVIDHFYERENLKHLTHPERSNIDLKFGSHESSRDFQKFFTDVTKGKKPRKGAVLAIEIVCAYTPGCVSDLKGWTQDSLGWAIENFGGKYNVCCAVVHMDEKEPHIHILMVPYNHERNKLCYSDFVDGPCDMRDLQDSYAKAVERHGLERGIDSRVTKAKHTSHHLFHYMEKRAEREVVER